MFDEAIQTDGRSTADQWIRVDKENTGFAHCHPLPPAKSAIFSQCILDAPDERPVIFGNAHYLTNDVPGALTTTGSSSKQMFRSAVSKHSHRKASPK
jgi:hypothetical protein